MSNNTNFISILKSLDDASSMNIIFQEFICTFYHYYLLNSMVRSKCATLANDRFPRQLGNQRKCTQWVGHIFQSENVGGIWKKFPNKGHVRDFDWVKKENTHLYDFFFHIRTVLRVNWCVQLDIAKIITLEFFKFVREKNYRNKNFFKIFLYNKECFI